LNRNRILAIISISILSTLACNLPFSIYKFFSENPVKDRREEIMMAKDEEEWNMNVVPDTEDMDSPIKFTGQLSFTCDEWVGDGGDSEGMGKIPINVNFDAGDFHGEASFSYVDDNSQDNTSTFVYQGSVSEEGILIGTYTMTISANNVDVGFVGTNLAVLGIVTGDGSGLYLKTYQESNTKIQDLYKAGRDAVLSDPANLAIQETTPNCR
jgi:hypothetical protein